MVECVYISGSSQIMQTRIHHQLYQTLTPAMGDRRSESVSELANSRLVVMQWLGRVERFVDAILAVLFPGVA